MEHWVIDRFEEDFAVILYGYHTAYIKKSALPQGAHEGSVFTFTQEEIILLPDVENEIIQQNTERLNRLIEKNQKK